MSACALLAALAGWGAPAARAASPAWDYVQYEALSGRLQSDETGTGSGFAVSVPLTGPLYARASGSSIEGRFHTPTPIPDEHFREVEGGFGLHDTWGKANAFGFVGYTNRARETAFPGGTVRDHEEGVDVIAGARILATNWLMIEPEGGYAMPNGFGRLRVAVRVVPHVWLTGAYSIGSFDGHEFWSGGVRLALNDSVGPPKRRPGAGWVDEAGGTVDLPERLEPGLALVALRPLTLQQKPLFGAREVATVPARTPIELVRAESNDFGGWWFVRAGGAEGWIRENALR